MNRTTVERKSDREVVVTRTFDAPREIMASQRGAIVASAFNRSVRVGGARRRAGRDQER